MGTWGPGLYQDDVTCDIRAEYIDRLKIGQSTIEATQELIKKNMDLIEDVEEGQLFWFALADTQWKYGRLLPEVKEEALRQIRLGTDLERWKENIKEYGKRKQVLKTLEDKLNSPLPPEKKVTKLVLQKAAWDVGDVLLFKIKNEEICRKEGLEKDKYFGKYILLRVIGKSRTNIGGLPQDEYFHEQNIVAIYNWVGDFPPKLEIIRNLKFIKTKSIYGRIEDYILAFDYNKRERKKLDFKVIMKDSMYKKPSDHIMSIVGVGFIGASYIEVYILKLLNRAKEDGQLIDDVKD